MTTWIIAYLITGACWGVFRTPHVIASVRSMGQEPGFLHFVLHVILGLLLWPIMLVGWLALRP